MPKKSAAVEVVSVDRARQTLAWHIERWCEQEVSNIKVRVNTADEVPQSVWFFGRVDNEWQKLTETVEGTEFGRLIAEEMERLAANPHSEECQVRRRAFRDRIDFDIRFHHEKIVSHQGPNLGSYLYGILFRERHAPKNPRRQGIRRGVPRALATT